MACMRESKLRRKRMQTRYTTTAELEPDETEITRTPQFILESPKLNALSRLG